MQNSNLFCRQTGLQFKINKFFTKTLHFKLYTLNFTIGQSLIELLLALGLSSIFLPALITGLVASREGKVQQHQRLQAVLILKETEEAIRNVKEKGWDMFAINGTYHPEASGSSWTLSSGSTIIDGFTQQVVISDVYRNTLAGPIVDQSSPNAVLDPSTKKIETTISWSTLLPSSIISTMYLTRYLENDAYTETTQTQFNAGTKTGVTVKATTPPTVEDDGELILGAGGRSNWCDPKLTGLSSNLSGNGVAQDIYAVEGRVFTGTGQNAAGLDFINIAVGNPPYPADPTVTEEGTYDGNLKTNGIFGETVDNISYAYLATDTNSKEVVIINASNNPPTVTSIINIDGPPNADSVFAKDNILYVASDAKLFTYNISDRASPQLLGSISIPSNATRVIVKGNYAFIALNSTQNQLKIIDVTNPSAMQEKGGLKLNDQPATDLFVSASGDRTYLVTSTSTAEEFFIINTANKDSPSLVSTGSKFDTNGMSPYGVTVVTGNRVIIVGHEGKEYQVLNIDNENSPVSCAAIDADNINSISSVREADGDAYSYIVTDNANSEFRIIAGGPGGSYSTYGEFESQTFNPGYTTANNRLSATFSSPPSTSIKFQVSMTNLVGGICPATGSYTFVGPDGTSSTYFTPVSGGAITFPFVTYENYINPGQCIRYKAYFSTTDPNNTPVLNDVTINYSP